MARMSNNNISGLVGTVVLYKWRGKAVMRSRPHTKSKRVLRAKRTPAQANSIARFGFASKVAKRFRVLFENSFEQEAGQLGRAQAIRYMLRGNAITGEAPDFKMDFSQLLVAKGPVRPATDPSVKRTKQNNLVFTWSNNSDQPGASKRDRAILVMYEEKHEAVFFTMEKGDRESGKGVMEIPPLFRDGVHTWISFVREDGKTADSIYCGKV
jgi:hypothetical protein